MLYKIEAGVCLIFLKISKKQHQIYATSQLFFNYSNQS